MALEKLRKESSHVRVQWGIKAARADELSYKFDILRNEEDELERCKNKVMDLASDILRKCITLVESDLRSASFYKSILPDIETSIPEPEQTIVTNEQIVGADDHMIWNSQHSDIIPIMSLSVRNFLRKAYSAPHLKPVAAGSKGTRL